MAQNQSSQNPARRPCEKIRKATFGRFRHVSHVPNPQVSAKACASFTQPMAFQQPISVKEIPIESVPPPEVKTVKNNVRFSNVKENGDGGGKELAGQKTLSEEKIDSFIGRMKMKMSAPSDVGGDKTVSRHDSFGDEVSNFIHRAKLKLRATSSMGANGKPMSFK